MNPNLGLEVVLEEIPWKQNLKELGKSIGHIEHKQVGSQERFVMQYPVGFKSADGKVSGKIDFGLFVRFEREGPTPKNFSLGFME